MKCTGKGISVFSVLVFSCALLTGCQSENTVAKYEAENYNNNLYEGHLYAEDLCVSKDDVEIEDFTGDSSLHAADFLISMIKLLIMHIIFMRKYILPARQRF